MASSQDISMKQAVKASAVKRVSQLKRRVRHVAGKFKGAFPRGLNTLFVKHISKKSRIRICPDPKGMPLSLFLPISTLAESRSLLESLPLHHQKKVFRIMQKYHDPELIKRIALRIACSKNRYTDREIIDCLCTIDADSFDYISCNNLIRVMGMLSEAMERKIDLKTVCRGVGSRKKDLMKGAIIIPRDKAVNRSMHVSLLKVATIEDLKSVVFAVRDLKGLLMIDMAHLRQDLKQFLSALRMIKNVVHANGCDVVVFQKDYLLITSRGIEIDKD